MPHCQLSLEERRRLARLRESRMPVAEIAAALGRRDRRCPRSRPAAALDAFQPEECVNSYYEPD